MQPRKPSLPLKVGEHVVGGVEVDLRCPSCLAAAHGLGNAARNIIELIAVQVNPVVPLRPMFGVEEIRKLDCCGSDANRRHNRRCGCCAGHVESVESNCQSFGAEIW